MVQLQSFVSTRAYQEDHRVSHHLFLVPRYDRWLCVLLYVRLLFRMSIVSPKRVRGFTVLELYCAHKCLAFLRSPIGTAE